MKKYLMMAMLAAGVAGLTACEQDMSDQAENKIEDVGHETGQAAERAGEKVEDAAD